MEYIRPKLVSVANLQTHSADTKHNKFKRAIHDVIVKLKEYQAQGVENQNLIPRLISDIYNPAGTRGDSILNHLRNILDLESDRSKIASATKHLFGEKSSPEQAKFLTFLAILHNKNACFDPSGKINPGEVIVVIKSLFANGAKIRFDESNIEDIGFSFSHEQNGNSPILTEIRFGNGFPIFKLTPHMDDVQNLDLNHVDELLKYGNMRFSKKYETGRFYDNTDGICAVLGYEFLTAEAKAFHATSKQGKTTQLLSLRDQRIHDLRDNSRVLSIQENYTSEIKKAKNNLLRERFYESTSIKKPSAQLESLIRESIQKMNEKKQSTALLYLGFDIRNSGESGEFEYGHVMAISITKKILRGETYFSLKFTDPNTDEGPIILNIKESELETHPLKFSEHIYYLREQLNPESDVTLSFYLPPPNLRDKDETLRVLEEVTSKTKFSGIENEELIKYIFEKAPWIDSQIDALLAKAIEQNLHGLLQAIMTYKGNRISTETFSQLLEASFRTYNVIKSQEDKSQICTQITSLFVSNGHTLTEHFIKHLFSILTNRTDQTALIDNIFQTIIINSAESKDFNEELLPLFLSANKEAILENNLIQKTLMGIWENPKYTSLTQSLILFLPQDQKTVVYLKTLLGLEDEDSPMIPTIKKVIQEKIEAIEQISSSSAPLTSSHTHP